MQEKLVIKNFIIIKSFEWDISKINIIIGENGQGKSIVAKVLCFSRYLVSRLNKTITEKDKNPLEGIQSRFKEKFKKYFYFCNWYLPSDEQKNFSIVYSIDGDAGNGFILTIEPTEDKEDVKFSYSYKRKDGFVVKEVFFENVFEAVIKDDPTLIKQLSLRNHLYLGDERSELAFGWERIDYSKHSNTKKNIDTDRWVKGIRFNIQELADEEYAGKSHLRLLDNWADFLKIENYYFIESDNGKKEYEVKLILPEDESKRKHVLLSQASSTQKEYFHVALALAYQLKWLENESKGKRDAAIHIYIEEPETHLFPTAQKQLMALLSAYIDECKNYTNNYTLVIATHSCLSLNQINNSIDYTVVKKWLDNDENCGHKDYKDIKERFESLVTKYSWLKEVQVDFNDVSAYQIVDFAGKNLDVKNERAVLYEHIEKAHCEDVEVNSTLYSLSGKVTPCV